MSKYVNTRLATPQDVAHMVRLSEQKRIDYAKAMPQFWHPSRHANTSQHAYFIELLSKSDHFLIVAEKMDQFLGFIIGKIITAPEVYDPGGLTLMIDDFCVAAPVLWQSVGNALLETLKKKAKAAGVVQIIVVSGFHDEAKRAFLVSQNLVVASEWYVGDV